MSYAPVQKEIAMSMKEDKAMMALLVRDWGFWLAMLGAILMGISTVYFYLRHGLPYAGGSALVFGTVIALGAFKCLKKPYQPREEPHPEKHQPEKAEHHQPQQPQKPKK